MKWRRENERDKNTVAGEKVTLNENVDKMAERERLTSYEGGECTVPQAMVTAEETYANKERT